MRPLGQRLPIAIAAPALLLALLLPRDATAQPSPNNNVVTMDKLEVNAVRFHWTHAQSPHFEILSNLDNTRFVTDIVRQAEQIITLYEKASPAIFTPRLDLPSKLIFIQDETMERFFAQSGVGSTQSDFNARMAGSPLHKNVEQFNNRYKISSFASHNDEQLVIVKLLTKSYLSGGQNSRDKSLESAADLAVSYLNECVLIRTGGARLPWLEAALNAMRGHPNGGPFNSELPPQAGQHYRTGWIGVDGDKITLGRYCLICEQDAVTSAADFSIMTREEKGKLWTNFMSAPNVSLGDIFNNTYAAPSFIAQAVVRQLTMQREVRDFLYYCLFGSDPVARRGFAKLIRAAATRPIDETLFKECFGAGYDTFRNAIYAFFQPPDESDPLDPNVMRNPLNPWGPPGFTATPLRTQTPAQPITFRPVERGEATRLISDWFDVRNAAAGSLDSLRKAYNDTPHAAEDPQFIATLGLCEARHGNRNTAIALLAKAADAKITRPNVYRTLARLYLDNALDLNGPDHPVNAGQLRDILIPLSTAFKQPQPNPQNYILFAAAWAHTDIKPTQAYQNIITEGCERFPGDIDMLENVLPPFAKRGYKARALRIANEAALDPLPPEKQQRLDKLIKKLKAE